MIQEGSVFQRGLLNYRIGTTILTLIAGMLWFMGDEQAPPIIYMYQAVFGAIVTGALGAAITSYQYGTFVERVTSRYLLPKEELYKNNYKVWRQEYTDFEFIPAAGIVMSLILMVSAHGGNGTLWMVVYTILSPLAAELARSIILSISGSPGRKRII